MLFSAQLPGIFAGFRTTLKQATVLLQLPLLSSFAFDCRTQAWPLEHGLQAECGYVHSEVELVLEESISPDIVKDGTSRFVL